MNAKLLLVCTIVAAGFFAFAGCCEPEDDMAIAAAPAPTAPRPAPRPPPSKPAPKASPCKPVGNATATMALPTGSKACGVIWLEKSAPEQVIVGGEFDYVIKLTNLLKSPVSDVILQERLSDNFKLTGTNPKSSLEGQMLVWQVGKMDAGETKLFTIRGAAKSSGPLVGCSHVTFKMPEVCLAIRAVQPALRIVKTAPAQALLCDPITHKITVTNTGTGPACNVVVRDELPAGMKTLDGMSVAAFKVGTLLPGQSQEVTVSAKASKTGKFVNKATAVADGGLSAQTTATTTVTKPELKVAKTGPNTRFVGRTATYTITVTNAGDGAARDTVLVDTIPAGTTLVSASDKGAVAAGKVTWQLGTLSPGDSKKVTVVLKMLQRGVVRNVAAASAYCAKGSGEAVTTVKGIPAILLECVDLEDPIEVGSNVTYEITVTNQGSAVGTNIVVECTLPDEQQFVSATGPTKETAKAKAVTFAPLASLAPQQKAVYRVVAKGLKPGDVRFTVTLKSDQMTSTSGETESTHIYSDN